MPFSSICQARRQHRHAELLRQRQAARAIAFERGVALAGVRHELEPREEMRQLEQILQHHAPDRRRPHRALSSARSARGGIALEHRLQQVEDQAAIGDAEHLAHRALGDRAAAQRDRLIEQRQPVAHRAIGGARDERDRRRLGLDAFRRGDRGVMRRSASPTGTRRSEKRWQRDSTVTGTLWISVVAKMNLTSGGGSSSVFNSALKAFFESMCTSSMM